MKFWLSLTGGFAVSACLLYLALRGVDFTRLLAVCRQTDYRWFVLVLFLTVTELLVRSVKWKLLLDSSCRTKFSDVFKIMCAGICLNNILPFRIGELARAAMAAGTFNISFFTSAASIVAERFVDLFALASLFCIAAAAEPAVSAFFGGPLYVFLLLILIFCGLLCLVYLDRITDCGLFRNFTERLPFIKKISVKLVSGAAALRRPSSAALIFCLGLLQWFIDALGCYFVGAAFSLTGVVSVFRSIVVIISAAAACSIPAMPGFFGNYEAAIAGVLKLWGVGQETAFAYALCVHMISFLTVTALGIFCLYLMGYSVSAAWKRFGMKRSAGEE